MNGLIMDYPLNLHGILRRAERVFPQREVATRQADGSLHRYTYGDFFQRVLKLATLLETLGVQPGDRVASFCWNHHQHLELYFAVPCVGAVMHTLNIRLSDEQLEYIVNHAGDKLIFVDASLAPQLERLQDRFPAVERFILVEEPGHGMATGLRRAAGYEELLAVSAAKDRLPDIAETTAAALCYTSGTTGNPKGVLYSHRSTWLHTQAVTSVDGIGLSQKDTVLPVVPMFHANCWGLAHAAVMTGAKLVLPGPAPQPAEVADLLAGEKVTLAAGVPTIWNSLYPLLREGRHDISALKKLLSGGSAVPRALIENYEKEFGIYIHHAWGMTEMSPLGTSGYLRNNFVAVADEERYRVRMKQGIPVPGVEVKVVDEQGAELPWDGTSVGELLVRGAWVASAYYEDAAASASFTADGWFRTGDMATMDEYAYMRIADRSKDLIKSGGEWISSVEMENLIMAHPLVLEAAVVARPDERWDERPVAFVAPVAGATLREEEIVTLLEPHFAKWQIPYLTDIRWINEVPKTSVGKFDKKVLRVTLAES